MKRAFELMEEHAAKESASDHWIYGCRWEFGHTARFYGFYLRGTGRPKEAIMPLKKAAGAFAKLVDEAPDRRENWDFLADTHREIADTYLAVQAQADAEAAMRQAVAIYEKLVTKMGKADYAWKLRTCYDRLASLLAANGKTQNAETVHRQASGFYEKLAKSNRNDPTFRDCAARSHHTFAVMLQQNKRSEFFECVRKGIGWPKVALDGRERCPTDFEFLQPLPPSMPHHVPAGKILLVVASNVLGRRLEGEMRRGESKVLQKGLTWVFLGMFLQTLDGVIGDRGGGIIATLGLDSRQRPVVLRMLARGEVPVMIVEAVGVVEPVLKRLAIYVPFARVVGPIPQRF
jgi:hypothetical protein